MKIKQILYLFHLPNLSHLSVLYRSLTDLNPLGDKNVYIVVEIIVTLQETDHEDKGLIDIICKHKGEKQQAVLLWQHTGMLTHCKFQGRVNTAEIQLFTWAYTLDNRREMNLLLL